MQRRTHPAGLTLIDLAATLLVLAAVLAVAVPTIAGARGDAGVQQSIANLKALGAAHVLYAMDWDLRQVTWVKDDLGAFEGDPSVYNSVNGPCVGWPSPPQCQPPAVAGFDCEGIGPYAYWPNLSNAILLQPMNFPGSPEGCDGCAAWGTFRIPNLKSLHDYVNGRYHDPVYYAPNDHAIFDPLVPCMEQDCEFVSDAECNPGWSSYAMSPAAMFHHDVLRSNAAGGWQAPWTIAHGYQGPGLFQASYPHVKTLMIEHSWVQGPPALCNPVLPGCEPYYFNQGIDSMPVALFYDLSVRLLRNADVLAADQKILQQTGGVDGLWHRGTSFGANGYLIDQGFDQSPLSHHILTTDGILGRDTLIMPVPDAVPLDAIAVRRAPAPVPAAALPTERRPPAFTTGASAAP